MFTGLMSLSTALNNATGDFSIVTRQYALLCVLTPLAVACGITLGNLPGAAMGLLLVTGTMFSLDVWLLKRLRGIRISEFWGSIWRPALGCLVMWLIVVLVKLTLPPMTEISHINPCWWNDLRRHCRIALVAVENPQWRRRTCSLYHAWPHSQKNGLAEADD